MDVAIVEDHALFRDYLRRLCQDLGLKVIAEEADGESALVAILRSKPELVLMDLELPGMDGFDLIKTLRREVPAVKFLVVSAHCEPYTAYRLEKLGVAGFVDKMSDTAGGLRSAVEAIEAGQRSFSVEFLRQKQVRLGDRNAFDRILTPREQEILCLVGVPETDREIGDGLGIAAATVEKHRFNIMRKLEIHSMACLVRFAREMGFALSARLRTRQSQETTSVRTPIGGRPAGPLR
jgi:DNA-binding NarL/FixJ family response regulator